MSPFFSVIIPLYNKENFILDTLKSVLNQNFKDFEIIIVDDGSSDGSLEKVNSIKNSCLKIISQENKGVSQARNKGISKAKGNYIALLDADDYWYKNHLENLKKSITTFPKANVYFNNYEIKLDKGFIKTPKYSLIDSDKAQYIDDYFKASMIDSLGWTSACCFTKQIFFKTGKFDKSLRSGQDTDLMIRLGLHGVIVFNPVITAKYIVDTENNLTKSNYVSDRIKFLTKYEKEEQNNRSLKAYLDSNRYALAIYCKMKGDSFWKKLYKNIDSKNLNLKQNFLLHFPGTALKLLKKIQIFLIKKEIYFTSYK